MELMWQGRRHSHPTHTKRTLLGAILVKVVSINFKRRNIQTRLYGFVQTSDVFAFDFTNKEESLEKESLMKKT